MSAYKLVRKIRALHDLRVALVELQELDPTGKLAGAVDALMGRPPKSTTGGYDEAFVGIRSAGIGGILQVKWPGATPEPSTETSPTP